MSSTTFNQDDIINNINEIFTECLIQDFIDTIGFDDWYEFDDYDKWYEYFEEDVIEPVFNRTYGNILENHNKSYTLDFKTSIKLLNYIKEHLVDNADGGDIFCDMFDEDVNSEIKIINMYAYWYIRYEWNDIYKYKLTDNWLIIRIFKKIANYNYYKNKHNKLINLYEKLDKKNKQKKTISKILNNKFDTDIIQNIICAY